ncbi:hypothetical protein EUX98_g6047 [Antrodiella citrinella]|uniref:Cytochrome P450 n=1 Tax=Antrodiella citrinella TaxID=2447956 RepID=A0A4S4MS56_9APHY|nr:hypothetical protein EUX98_g6047 [Antrodiella citrinella]
MAIFSDIPSALAALFVLILATLYGYGLGKSRYPFPPGPKGIPILGNVHQLPKEHQQRAFFEWKKTFGDLIYVRLFRTSAIIVNSVHIARDLMEKQSANYSDRPPFILIKELMGFEGVLPFMSYGARFRKMRKWFHAAFQPQELVKYRSFQVQETYVVLDGLINHPDDFTHHFMRFGGAVLMEVTYAHRVRSNDDPYMRAAHEALNGLDIAGSAGGALVDFFPILKYYPSWMPGGMFKKHAQRVYDFSQLVFDAPYNMVKEKMESGTGRTCFTSNIIEEHLQSGTISKEDEVDIKGAAATFYAAGVETLVAFLSTLILAMVLYPEVFKKAQAEVDRVVGLDRLPDFHDRDSLPYLNSVIKEIYRAMARNEEYYPDPDEFLPERYMDNAANQDLIDPKNITFGFGRRLCPGRDFADASVYLLTANIIATMDISKARDSEGREITPLLDVVSGIVSSPKPFKCSIKPRSQRAIDLVRQVDLELED